MWESRFPAKQMSSREQETKNPAEPKPAPPAPLIACPECDLLQREVAVPLGGTARCLRCGAVLYRSIRHSLDVTLAFLLAAAMLYLISNIYPMVGLEAQGVLNHTSLLGAVHALLEQHLQIVALLVFVTAVLAPAVEIGAMIYLLLPLRFGRLAPGSALVLRTVGKVKQWNMIEVFMLGLLVSLVKLMKFANVVPEIALWSFAGLTLLMTAAAASFDQHGIWRMVSRRGSAETESIS